MHCIASRESLVAELEDSETLHQKVQPHLFDRLSRCRRGCVMLIDDVSHLYDFWGPNTMSPYLLPHFLKLLHPFHLPHSIAALLDPEVKEVLSGLKTNSGQLQLKLAMAQERLRHGQRRVSRRKVPLLATTIRCCSTECF